ncbi:MAG: thiol peroxidase [Bryobacterales bacterium]|nr:thiol peroxidase [Bryobacterales bacterium]
MSRQCTLKGNPFQLQGDALNAGDAAPDFTLTGNDLSPVKLADTSGVRVINVVPSLDTPVCDLQIKRFNEEAAALENVSVYCVSCDLPFAQKRWCGAAGVDRVTTLSDYKDGNFGRAWGTMIDDLKIQSRAVFVVSEHNTVVHAEYVPEVAEHPDYEAALAAARGAA